MADPVRPARAGRRPNILHILSDQHTASVLGCYGDPTVATPNLDRLAVEGALFRHLYVPSPLCTPSRMSLLTGLHPHETRVWTNEDALSPSIPTMAHALGAAGYRTHLSGRLHSIGPDQLLGYGSRSVGDHSPNHPGLPSADLGVLEGAPGPGIESLQRSGSGLSGYQVHDEVVTADAIGILRRAAAGARLGLQTQPFALTVGYMLPHQPYVAPRELYRRYYDTLPPRPGPGPSRRIPI